MSRGQVSRTDWLYAALDALGDGGVSGVRVDVLAKRLGITRGSLRNKVRALGISIDHVVSIEDVPPTWPPGSLGP